MTLMRDTIFLAVDQLPLASIYYDDECARLVELATALAARTRFTGEGLEVTPEMKALVCSQAVIPILNLGIDAYRHIGGVTITAGDRVDPDSVGLWTGIVHLAWDPAREGIADPDDGYNVILHEFAHALDVGARIIRHGRVPGADDHRDHDRAAFVRALMTAFLHARVRKRPADLAIYCKHALSSPSELFAFSVEFFFEAPFALEEEFPEYYAALCALFDQDPATRLREIKAST